MSRMKIIVEVRSTKEKVEFDNYDEFNDWLLLKTSLWIMVRFEFK